MGYGRYMEGRYDKELEWKQAKEDRLQADKMLTKIEELKKEKRDQLIADKLGDEKIPEGDEEAINAIFNDYGKKEENGNEYLVDGAYLKCDMAFYEIKEILGVPCGYKIYEKAENLKGTVLHVFGQTEVINGGMAATVKDHILNKNIEPLKCNCRNMPDRISEIQKFYENIDLCRQYGTCQVLMRLDRDWENIIRSNEYEEYNYTDDGKEIKGAKAITMKSMLFCSHGGIITPVSSGQIIQIVEEPTVSAKACTSFGEHAGSLSEEQIFNNAQYIYNYLEKQGWTMEAICGFFGNIFRESSMNPGIWNTWNNIRSAYGLAQWRPASDFLAHASLAEPKDANDMAEEKPQELMDLQLEFLENTMKAGGGRWYAGNTAKQYFDVLPPSDDACRTMTGEDFIESTRDPGDLAIVFHACYERSTKEPEDEPAIRRRKEYAILWYSYFSGQNPNLSLSDFDKIDIKIANGG